MKKQQQTDSVEQEIPEDKEKKITWYRVRFRKGGQEFTSGSQLEGVGRNEMVMVKVEHGLEPATVIGCTPVCPKAQNSSPAFVIIRRPTNEEIDRFDHLVLKEGQAFGHCCTLIEKHQLAMHLVRVERFFNGSKMIFYFTADKRIDFRALVKDLVQEYRTRVEMRQVGVRHETQMIGGLGTCGRELCCSLFIKKFDSVSIKMAKEQGLPLNPTKISGVCNRLLCCLTYEYDTYRKYRKNMPRPGSFIRLGEEEFKVKRQNPLQETLNVIDSTGDEHLLEKEEWKNSVRVKPAKKKK